MLCIVVYLSQNHVDINIKKGHGVSWRLVCFYGFLKHERREAS